MDPENKEKEPEFEVAEGVDLESTEVDHGEDETKVEAKTEDDKTVAEKKETEHKNEVEQYGKNVKKRIDKLTYQVREAERREQAAIQYAQGLQKEIEQKNHLQNQVQTKDDALFGQYSQNVDTNLEVAKENYKRAHESGDVDALIEAQQVISRLSVEKENLRRVAAKRKRAAEIAKQQSHPQFQQQGAPQQQQPQQVQQQAPVDPKAEEWAEKNEWFGNDEAMTFAAFGIHRKLLTEGVDPSSDLYYNKLDEELKATFPSKLGNTNTPSHKRQTVAGANRSSGNGRSNKVQLSQSEIAIANKLGVPLERYAKYKTA